MYNQPALLQTNFFIASPMTNGLFAALLKQAAQGHYFFTYLPACVHRHLLCHRPYACGERLHHDLRR